MKNRLLMQHLILVISLSLALSSPVQARILVPNLPTKAPSGPFEMTINVYIDAEKSPSLREMRESMTASAELLKKNLNLTVHWRYMGKLKKLESWKPIEKDELASKFIRHKRANANLIFTNRYWDEQWLERSPRGVVVWQHITYAGFCVREAQTMVIYEASTNAKEKAEVVDCSLNTIVIQHEFGHLLGLEHDFLDPGSIMSRSCNQSGGIWRQEDVTFAQWQLALRGYQKWK